ncbi:MAG: mycothione reductase [Chloroflexi bacterium]|nr:mycothione reductase [Chloroflexota bacterium]
MRSFDLIVIGSGSGLEVSSEAADRGQSVAVIEPGPFGGTCLNRGCIPSKMLIHSADVLQTIRSSELFGIKAEVSEVDWDFIIGRATDTIDADAQAVEEGNRQHPNVTVFKDSATFVDDKVLEVAGERVTAETIVVAAGTRPRVPEIEGLSDVPFITSDEALRLPKQPQRLVIVGGGYIAAEMAHFFGALGTEVTLVQRGPRLLRQEDTDVADRFTEVYQRRFKLLLDTTIQRAYKRGEEIVLDATSDGQEQTLTADALLLAVGRVPNTDLLDMAKTGVTVDDQGFVQTDDYLETNVPGIWALGDIVGRYLLKHSANLEAAFVGHNIFNPDSKVPVDYHAMPHAIFASPQVAAVGVTEQEAREAGLPFVSSVYNYYDTAYGSSIEDRDGFVKVLAHRETREILGCHIIGSEASMLIQEVANAMRKRLTTDAITQAIYVHPALPEVVQRAFGGLPS